MFYLLKPKNINYLAVLSTYFQIKPPQFRACGIRGAAFRFFVGRAGVRRLVRRLIRRWFGPPARPGRSPSSPEIRVR